ncbi:MAG TPA: hypothetical protein VFA26_18410, partial [Gemmataceae bacterium]|nr:hypothetical protein [Gemmataceae bacterium]
MDAVVKCPFCGQKCRPVETPGQQARCPACLNFIPARPAPAPALAGGLAPAAGPAPNRTVLAQPEAMIHYRCPRCNKPLESPASFAGQKLNCPDCNQRLQIPQPSTPPAAPPVNKTILAAEDRPAPAPAPSSRPHAPAEPIPVVEAVDDGPARAAPAPAARRESCLECGADVTKQPRIQTCPDCGSIFCSARC